MLWANSGAQWITNWQLVWCRGQRVVPDRYKLQIQNGDWGNQVKQSYQNMCSFLSIVKKKAIQHEHVLVQSSYVFFHAYR